MRQLLLVAATSLLVNCQSPPSTTNEARAPATRGTTTAETARPTAPATTMISPRKAGSNRQTAASGPCTTCEPDVAVEPTDDSQPAQDENVKAVADRAIEKKLSGRLPLPLPYSDPDPHAHLWWLHAYLGSVLTFPASSYDIEEVLRGLDSVPDRERRFIIDNLPPGDYDSSDQVIEAIMANVKQSGVDISRWD